MLEFKTWNVSADPDFRTRSVAAFDLDDTLTDNGALPPPVIAHLAALQNLGCLTVLVTGRSAGWVDALIKLLPFDAIVGENGGLLNFWPQRKSGRKPREESKKLFWTPQGYQSSPPLGLKEKHLGASQKILAQFPGTRVASDQPYRLYDLAIDFAEEVNPPLPLSVAYEIQKELEALGAVAKVSSIHVNAWWGAFSKADGLRYLLEKNYGKNLNTDLLYAGDSPNDGPLFEVAGLSVGVANIKAFAQDESFYKPKFVTQGESSQGALEILKAMILKYAEQS